MLGAEGVNDGLILVGFEPLDDNLSECYCAVSAWIRGNATSTCWMYMIIEGFKKEKGETRYTTYNATCLLPHPGVTLDLSGPVSLP